MNFRSRSQTLARLGTIVFLSLMAVLAAIAVLPGHSLLAHAQAPDQEEAVLTITHIIPPEEGGAPKLTFSNKTVSPTLVFPSASSPITLYYRINLFNTGAYSASNTTVIDTIPLSTTYVAGSATASDGSPVTYTTATRTLAWQGEVGFYTPTVVISFSVAISPNVSGIIQNDALISDPLLTEPLTRSARTIVTDIPLFEIGKATNPAKPGANKLLTYTLAVTNIGQPAFNIPITVTDQIPVSTTLVEVGPDGISGTLSDVITWTRNLTVANGETTSFYFTVQVDDVPSQTVITNAVYQITNPANGQVTSGSPVTVTVVEPDLRILKTIDPDPPGSNRGVTYTISIVNQGSLATGLVITDRVPAVINYTGGGTLLPGNVVSWSLASLDTGETAEFTFTANIGDIFDAQLVNQEYQVCSAEGVCAVGEPLSRTIEGPHFVINAFFDPLAKKPGGGTTNITPTVTIRNLGPGNALLPSAAITYYQLSINNTDDIAVIPAEKGVLSNEKCGPKCEVFYLTITPGLSVGEVITVTTIEGGVSTKEGSEGTIVTVTAIITDRAEVNGAVTEPVVDTAIATITHFSNLVPNKSGPTVIGPGQLLTYTINVRNSSVSTDNPAEEWSWTPALVDPLPAGTTFVRASNGGVTRTLTSSEILSLTNLVSGTTVVSWSLGAMSTGDSLTRTFTVRVNDDVISGTKLVNTDYRALWYETQLGTATASDPGATITTTVKEVGLIASFKTVTPTLVNSGGVLTYVLHIANSSPAPLTGVSVEDLLPWEHSTYQQDAITSSGVITEQDIVSVHWVGDVSAFSQERITLTVKADPDYTGLLTNTMIISHQGKVYTRTAVGYVAGKPVLDISKTVSPDEGLDPGDILEYTIQVGNTGRQASLLVITDKIPANTEYIPNSASDSGKLVGDQLQWGTFALDTGQSRTFSFQVKVLTTTARSIVNTEYKITSEADPGLLTIGVPVRAFMTGGKSGDVYLPIIVKNN